MIVRRMPSVPSWTSAFRGAEDVRRELSRLFDSLSEFSGPRTAGVFPAINVTETDEALRVRAELPGIDVASLNVTVEDDTLTLAGERTTGTESEAVGYHRREREWGRFRRSFQLPVRVDAQQVQARYRDGILWIELPKAAEARPRQIAVQTGA